MGPVVAQAKAKATQLHTENVALRAKLRVATESRERAAKAEDQLKKVNKALWAKLRLVTEKVAKQKALLDSIKSQCPRDGKQGAQVLRAMIEQPDAWEIVTFDDENLTPISYVKADSLH